MIKLHCFSQSGNAYKVGFALNAMGVPWQPVFVDFMHGATRDPDWREHSNIMGEIPVLEDGDLQLTQSGVILTYLAEQTGQFGGQSAQDQREILRWILFDNHKFTSYFATYRFLKAFSPKQADPAVMQWLRARIDAAYDIVNRHLANVPFLIGAQLSIADFSLSGYLFYPLEETGYEIDQRFPHIAAWRERLRAVKGWVDPYQMMPGERILPNW